MANFQCEILCSRTLAEIHYKPVFGGKTLLSTVNAKKKRGIMKQYIDRMKYMGGIYVIFKNRE